MRMDGWITMARYEWKDEERVKAGHVPHWPPVRGVLSTQILLQTDITDVSRCSSLRRGCSAEEEHEIQASPDNFAICQACSLFPVPAVNKPQLQSQGRWSRAHT